MDVWEQGLFIFMEENDLKNYCVVEEFEDELYGKIKELKICLVDVIDD